MKTTKIIYKPKPNKSAFLKDESDKDTKLNFKVTDEKWKGFGKKKVKTFFN